MKGNTKGKFEATRYFLNSLSQNFDFFYFFESFEFPRWRHQPNNGWKRFKLVFYVPMLIGKTKRYFQVNYSFMKPFSQKTEVLTQCFDVINTKLAPKRIQTVSLVRMLIEKQKWKVKRALWAGIRLWNYLKTLAPCCNVIIPKSGQIDSSLYIMYNWL